MSHRSNASPWGLVGAAGVFLLLVVYSPALDAGFWSPKAAVALVLGGLGLPLLFIRPQAHLGLATWGARAFVAWAAVSTAVSGHAVSALAGAYNVGTGLLFVTVLAGCWAIGGRIVDADRAWLARAVVAGASLNIAVAILEMAFDLRVLQLSRVFGRAPGLMGNPVFLGTLLGCALPLAIDMVVRSRRSWTWAVALVPWGMALRLSGGRAALGLAVVALAWTATRTRRRGLVAGCTVALFLGAFWAPALDRPPVDGASPGTAATALPGQTAPADVSDAVEAEPPLGEWVRPGRPLTPRLSTWWSARHAIAREPLVGSGPGRFRAATIVDRPLVVARDTPDVYFTDAHNLVVEYAVTTGVVGLALLGVWLFPALRRLHDEPLAATAVLALAAHLVQPQYVGLTPVALLLLGAATRAGGSPGRPRWVTAVVPLSGAVAGALGILLLLGVYAHRQARLDFDLAHALRAEALLAPWQQPLVTTGAIHMFRAAEGRPGSGESARAAVARATRREPDNPAVWTLLAEIETSQGQVSAAKRHFLEALALDQWSARALTGMGRLMLLQDRPADAVTWFRRSADIDPDGPGAQLLAGLLGDRG